MVMANDMDAQSLAAQISAMTRRRQRGIRLLTEVINTHPYFLWNGVSSEDYGIMVF